MSQAIWDVAVADTHAGERLKDNHPLSDRLLLEKAQGKVTTVLSTDFCPWANKYVYWLKEPIGWFVMALGISVLVGMHVNPLGWTLAAAIGSIIAIGMVWPWIAVRTSQCDLAPAIAEIHEGEECELVFSVRNRLPLPLWGLAVEGYLDREGDEAKPTIALACVPPISAADYRLAVCPQLRGHYPLVAPMVACSFPFGIWTARRVVNQCSPLVVYPQVSVIQDEATLTGGRMSESGDGLRAGQMGEPLGVREFRSGDRLKNVHWVHTARTGNLVVCERGGPQQQAIEVHLDTRALSKQTGVSRDANHEVNREAIAWRVRVAASLVTHLHARHVPVTLRIDQRTIHGAAGPVGLRRMLLALAIVPADGTPWSDEPIAAQRNNGARSNGATMWVSSDEAGAKVHVDYSQGNQHGASYGGSAKPNRLTIDLTQPVPAQLLRFWRGVEHARSAA